MVKTYDEVMNDAVVNWADFESKHHHQTEAFEDLSFLLFIQDHNFASGDIRSVHNQPGIECEPLKDRTTGKWIGYQSKYSVSSTPYAELKSSIETARDKKRDGIYPELDIIEIFIKNQANIRSQSAQDIETIAAEQNIEIKWNVGKYFQGKLGDKNNYQLLLTFFGSGDYQSFIRDNSDNVAQSGVAERIELFISKSGTVLSESDFIAHISEGRTKIGLLIGGAGCGKTSLLSLLSQTYPSVETNALHFGWPHEYLPVVIRLKEIESISLAVHINTMRKQYELNPNYKYAYILDGLDEISLERASRLAGEVRSLINSQPAYVLLSGRRSSFNVISFINSSEIGIEQFEVARLNHKQIDDFFKKYKNGKKYKRYAKLKDSALFDEVSDVFQLKLLAKNIDMLDSNSTVADLYELYLNHRLYNADLARVNSLDILDSKQERIIELNKGIAKKMFDDESSIISLGALQALVRKSVAPASNAALNRIVDYQASTFLAAPQDSTGQPHPLSYTHKRLQDYFVVSMVSEKILEADWRALRTYRILSTPDLLNNLLLPMLAGAYQGEDLLHKRLALSLLEYYIDLDDGGLGVYFDDLARLLSRLSNDTFDYMLHKADLPILEKVKADTDSIAYFVQGGKQDYANKLIDNYNRIIRKAEKEDEGVLDTRNYFNLSSFYKGKILMGDSLTNLYGHAKGESDRADADTLQSLMWALIEYDVIKAVELVALISDSELASILPIFIFPKNMPLITNANVKSKIIGQQDNLEAVNDPDIRLAWLFLKKFYSLDLDGEQIAIARAESVEIRKHNERGIDWRMHDGDLESLAALEFVLTEQDDDDADVRPSNFRYIIETEIYSQTYSLYIKMLKGSGDPLEFIRRHVLITESYHLVTQHFYTTTNLTDLWVEIILFVKDETVRRDIFTIIVGKSEYISNYLLLSKLAERNKQVFLKVATENDVDKLAETLGDSPRKEYQEYVNDQLTLGFLYANFDDTKPVMILRRVLDTGLVRHGWRKDIIASYLFTTVLEIAWDMRLYDLDGLRKITLEALDMLIQVIKITDGKGTSRGPQNLLEAVMSYDFDFALEIYDKIQKDDEAGLDSQTRNRLIKRSVELAKPLNETMDIYKSIVPYRDHERRIFPEYYYEALEALTTMYLAAYEDYEKEEVLNEFDALIYLYSYSDNDYIGDSYPRYLKTWNRAKIAFGERLTTSVMRSPARYKHHTDTRYSSSESKPMSAGEFVKKMNSLKNGKQLEKLLIGDGSVIRIALTFNSRTSKMLVRRCIELTGSIAPIIKYLDSRLFTKYGETWSANSNLDRKHAYEYILLAVLDNPDSHDEGVEYLGRIGYGGFYNAFRLYSMRGNKVICRLLISEYLAFIKFLVYK